MFLRQFHYLVALEQEGHFGRAAERCNVSQPTLSSAIRQLEDELGIPIILRHQKFQGFTEEGRRMVEWSKRLLADRDAMLEELAIMRDNVHGRLRIGAMPMSSPILPVFCNLFNAQHPSVQIDIQFLGFDKMTLGLKNFELDIGISYLEQQPLDRFMTLSLYQERLCLLLPDNDWLQGQESATWRQAASLPLCLLSPFMHERRLMDQAFASMGCVPKPRLESNSIFQLVFHVMSGDIATVVPQNFTRVNNAFQGTREKLLEQPLVSQNVGLVWTKGNPVLPMARAAAEIMQEALATGEFQEAFQNSSKCLGNAPPMQDGQPG